MGSQQMEPVTIFYCVQVAILIADLKLVRIKMLVKTGNYFGIGIRISSYNL
jgi:hypothetical protein